MPAILLFPAGLILGSFLTVVGHRVPRGESVVGGRSRCPTCDAQIAAHDNIPLVSWLLLRGRARCCGARISPRYPLTELALGLLFAATALALAGEDPAELLLGLLFVSTLLVVTITDLERRIIPDKILAVSATAAIVIVAATDPAGLPERAIAAAAAGGLFFAAALAYPRGMGLGDVKLAATMGLFLGRDVGPAIFVALLSASLVGLAIVARKGSAARKQAIPFGPFLALGGIVGLLAGEQLIEAYLSGF